MSGDMSWVYMYLVMELSYDHDHDEFHYLLKCDYFSEKIKTYIDKKYFKNCDILKFGTLLNQTKNKK
jgi:hypothetical protein